MTRDLLVCDALTGALSRALDLNREDVQAFWRIAESGWLDGGCFCLAEALCRWAGEAATPYGLRLAHEDIYEHACVVVQSVDGREYALDGDGACPLEDYQKRWQHREQMGHLDMILEEIDRARLLGAAMADEVFDVSSLSTHLGHGLESVEPLLARPVQALIVNPETQEITSVSLPSQDLGAIAEAIHAEDLHRVSIQTEFGPESVFFAPMEIGRQMDFIQLDGLPSPIPGRAVFIGETPLGAATSTRLSPETLSRRLRYISPADIQREFASLTP